jgi:hypothetical protein
VAECGTKGRFIRHAFLREQTAPTIRPLTVSMIESSLGTLLMTPVGHAPLLAIGLVSTGRTAVTVPSVAVAADPEQLAAGEANTQT